MGVSKAFIIEATLGLIPSGSKSFSCKEEVERDQTEEQIKAQKLLSN